MKDLGGYVFRFFPAGHPPRDEHVDPVEIGFIQLGEAAGIALRSFDQAAFGCVVLGCFQIRSPQRLPTYLMMQARTKVTASVEIFSGFSYPGLGLLS